jgi:hypothetical protein
MLQIENNFISVGGIVQPRIPRQAIGPQMMLVGLTNIIDANFDCLSNQKEANMTST